MTDAPTIHQALASVKKAIGAVGKSEKNQQQGFSYRGIDAVLNAVSGPLADNGVTVYPVLQDYTYGSVEIGRNKTVMAHVIVKVKYVFVGPAGDQLDAYVAAESFDSGDKAMTKAFSVALRTALIQTLSLPTDEPDPDATVYERSSSVQQEAAKAPKSTARSTRPGSEASSPSSSPSSPEPATETDIAKFVTMIENARNSDQLNKAWTAIGAKGALQTEIERDGTKVTLEKFLFQRNDAIKSTAS